MRRYVLHLLLLVNVALCLVLVWLWLTPEGKLRDVHWQSPAGRRVDVTAMTPALPNLAGPDTGRFLAMLDRPLFSASRRPPPPPPPPAAAEPVDNLSTARVSGVVQGAGTGGVILNIAGKDRRVRLNDAIDGWSLKSIDGRTITFVRSGQTRVLQMARGQVKTYTGLAQPELLGPAPMAVQPNSVGDRGNPPNSAGAGSAPAPSGPPRATFGGRATF